MRIYFAAPLFNAAEQRFNARLTWQLEEHNHRVFLPQRDGLEMAMVDPADPGAVAEMRRRVFALDTAEVMAADVIVAILDGRVPDEGVCVEIGIAWATRLTRGGSSPAIVGLKTDARTWLPADPVNPMVSEALDALVTDEASLLRWVACRGAVDDDDANHPDG